MNDTQGRHNAILENRQRLQLSGVTDVDSFDEDEIRLFTQLGELTIKGKDLHMFPWREISGLWFMEKRTERKSSRR